MRRVTLLIFIAFLLFGLILYVRRPELIEDFYLWILGLSGPILVLFRSVLTQVSKWFSGTIKAGKSLFSKKKEEKQEKAVSTHRVSLPSVISDQNPPSNNGSGNSAPLPASAVNVFPGITFRLVRFSDDGQTTVGRLYEIKENKPEFRCYTLEDTFRKQKIAGETRIPAGTYRLDFNVAETPLTRKYRTRYPDWFTYHLHIKEVPQFEGIYIHHGGTHKDTRGCILISDKLNKEDKNTFLTNSRNTFKWFYQEMKQKLEQGSEMRIIIED